LLPPQPVSIAAYTSAIAITFAFGLRRYRGMPLKQAIAAGAILTMVQFASIAALSTFLASRGLSMLQAHHVAATIFLGACPLIVMAIFDSDFRRIPAGAGFVLLYSLPYGLFVWLFDTHRIAISDQVLNTVIWCFLMFWMATIGYWLQKAPHVSESGRDLDIHRTKAATALGRNISTEYSGKCTRVDSRHRRAGRK
jgi:hypothetical protein